MTFQKDGFLKHSEDIYVSIRSKEYKSHTSVYVANVLRSTTDLGLISGPAGVRKNFNFDSLNE